ncbi:hypothetical protein ABZT51_27450 [Streptomyces sp. NPDC005373]|uniref:hypothetical protein n=1 Tax=unclassified Streptomyces TaxID=2593676 RepID=UPI0033AB0B3E
MVFHSEYADVEPVDEPVHDAVLGGAAARGNVPGREYVAGRVAPYKKVRRVEFVDAVPRAASGKILRRQLRETS